MSWRVLGKRSSRAVRHTKEIEKCKFCAQECTELLLDTSCTEECLLAYFFPSMALFDHVYTRISSGYDIQEHVPLASVQRSPHETVREFWTRNIDTIYPDRCDYRRTLLTERLTANSCECILSGRSTRTKILYAQESPPPDHTSKRSRE